MLKYQIGWNERGEIRNIPNINRPERTIVEDPKVCDLSIAVIL